MRHSKLKKKLQEATCFTSCSKQCQMGIQYFNHSIQGFVEPLESPWQKVYKFLDTLSQCQALLVKIVKIVS